MKVCLLLATITPRVAEMLNKYSRLTSVNAQVVRLVIEIDFNKCMIIVDYLQVVSTQDKVLLIVAAFSCARAVKCDQGKRQVNTWMLNYFFYFWRDYFLDVDEVVYDDEVFVVQAADYSRVYEFVYFFKMRLLITEQIAIYEF